ncbi:DUF1499 domain-containing protein [Porphyrobacter sp. AAP82]|uniref:DUF1499 domain-containing protein n=1 Tax=Porphyrobacter sp. AAP82 TaxID=1248917 RepID=UPI00030301A2|nr:DUF1499 domain-containing protein [Porphyrobacter sp. AAP82]
MTRLPRSTKLTLALLVIVPVWFVIAALGTRFGVWDWKFGLMTLTLTAGLILLVVLGLAALVALVLAIRSKPRRLVPLAVAGAGLVAVGAAAVFVGTVGGKGAENPIHDIATDTANPPVFSAETLAERAAAKANPVSDYQTPLGELEPYKARASKELAVKSYAQIITARSDRPAPLPLGGATREQGVAAVAAAMEAMGLQDIRQDAAAGTVEGVAQSFWFGFKDDVVARVGEAQIDFRSVSRVGVSDLGANTARINDLRARTETLLGTAAR